MDATAPWDDDATAQDDVSEAPPPDPRYPGIDIFIPGKPAPQGSKRHVGNGRMVESSKEVGPWRESIRWALARAGRFPDGLPVRADLLFVLYRPGSTPKRGPRSTPAAIRKPDLDKLARAVLDAVTSAGVWPDDSCVTHLSARKRIALPGEPMGLRLRLSHDADHLDRGL